MEQKYLSVKENSNPVDLGNLFPQPKNVGQ